MLKRKALYGLIVLLLLISGLMAGYHQWSKDNFFVYVNGDSMYPTLKDGQIATFSKVDDYSRDTIVIFSLAPSWQKEWKGNKTDKLIKRVVGQPGDTLAWDGENWLINGEWVGAVLSGGCEIEPFEGRKLEADEIFVAGDVIDEKTLDSRQAFCFGIEDYLVDTATVEQAGKLAKTYGG